MRFKSFAAMTTLGLMMATSALAETTMVWDKKPLNIVLPVGEQRYVTFPEKVAFGLPKSFESKLEAYNDNQVLYITAEEAFPTHQFRIKTESNRVIVVNLSAQQNASDEPINIVYPKPVDHTKQTSLAQVSLQDLMRYSIQQYYAPDRLLKPVKGIQKSMSFDGKSYSLFPTGAVTAIPLDSYTGGGITITAVYLKNNISIPVELKTDQICGAWVASSFFPQSRLTPSGSRYDSSMLFLVSNNDFISTYNGTCGLGV